MTAVAVGRSQAMWASKAASEARGVTVHVSVVEAGCWPSTAGPGLLPSRGGAEFIVGVDLCEALGGI